MTDKFSKINGFRENILKIIVTMISISYNTNKTYTYKLFNIVHIVCKRCNSMILQDNSAERNRGITLASIKGIIGNVVLVIFKMIIGLASNSIAIILDAVNNLTDVLSSVLTIVGTKLAAKGADKEHPFGHGRIEYMTTMAIAFIILGAGIGSLKESIDKILHPEVSTFDIPSLAIIAVAIVVKVVMGAIH